MPVRLVGEGIDVDPPRRRLSGDSLPAALGVRVRDGDLKAVGWKPPRVIEVFIAIAAAAAGAFGDNLSICEVAYDGVGPGILGSRVLTDVGDVVPVGREKHVLIRGPDVGGHWSR